MKKLIPFILLFIAVSIQAQPDTCHPTFKEIFDLNAGDVYVYKINSFSGGIFNEYTATTEKIEITAKKIINNSIIYYRKIVSASEYDFTCLSPSCMDLPRSSATSYTDSIVYADSADHYLNKCSGDSIILNSGQFNFARITYIDSSIKKISFGDTLHPLSYPNMIETYQKGFGIISSSYKNYDYTKNDTLIAYIKNNDTVGKIPTDKELFKFGITQYKNDNNIFIFPNPARENFTIELPMEYEACQIELISAEGSVVLSTRFLNSGQNIISTGNIAPGFYVVRIAAGREVFYKKVVLY